jgi:hypothetical protein
MDGPISSQLFLSSLSLSLSIRKKKRSPSFWWRKRDLTDLELSPRKKKKKVLLLLLLLVLAAAAGSVFKVCYRNIYERQDFFFFFLSLLYSPASIAPCNLRFVLWYTYTSRTGFSLSHYIREKRLFLLVLFFLTPAKTIFPPKKKNEKSHRE